ncbi:hypothetical protein [Williamsia deligens]|uniref:NfeD-like C-terminal domain-containing protein n=1 Tax=Williamsia deligens TaxID=321325 RepID=A0ABW3G7T8_9NOCA|nr:hypothetical protein [Williamsia deligens]MCP2192702.1 hypothetical protein [Williamsia deligens]
MAGLVGRMGVVVLPPGPDGIGEVEIRVGGTRETYVATAEVTIEVGATVLVVEDLGGRQVAVIPWAAPPEAV